MQADANAKQLVVERVKSATNILVTVSRDPSVDELAAALAFTLMLNKLDKHATAVFSGTIPSALEFLEPKKTFEDTVDSLRDFIIALDKEKADRLRYKVEDDVVRIFITPYRTVLSEKDLQFSQGDFNVELIVALGVEKKEDLDTAITAHGRILHDATVVTVNANNDQNSLGTVNWSDDKASSLCEMLMSLSEALQSGILDEQIATSLLTGIVAATDRFRNEHTSPKVMTMAAQLMAAGANQQLIAAKLEAGHELPGDEPAASPDGSTSLKEGQSQRVKRDETPEKPATAKDTPKASSDDKPADKPDNDGEIAIDHGSAPTAEPAAAAQPKTDKSQDEIPTPAPAAATLSVDDLKKDLENATNELTAAAEKPLGGASGAALPTEEPTFNATFNATTEAAAAEKRQLEQENRQHTLLSHDDERTAAPGPQAVMNSATSTADEGPTVDVFAQPPNQAADASVIPSPASVGDKKPMTLEELEAEARGANAVPTAPATPGANDTSLDDARAAVNAAIESQFDPAHNPTQGIGAQPMQYIETAPSGVPANEPDFTSPVAAEPTSAPTADAGMPPLPDFSTLPPLPTEPPAQPAPTASLPTQESPSLPQPLHLSELPESPDQNDTPAAPTDPGQFRLPGQ